MGMNEQKTQKPAPLGAPKGQVASLPQHLSPLKVGAPTCTHNRLNEN
jgi:hypothetical protein